MKQIHFIFVFLLEYHLNSAVFTCSKNKRLKLMKKQG